MKLTNQIVIDKLTEVVADSELNALHGRYEGEPAWDAPVIGFARGDDEFFDFLKEHIGEEHFKPIEIFKKIFPDEKVEAEDLSVISYGLPQTAMTKADQAKMTDIPSERWSRARMEGEEFNEWLRVKLADMLIEMGYPATAPMQTPYFKWIDHPEFVWSSTWSERHTAYACGLGTFGLSRGLISEKGIAMRYGSVVVKAKLQPSPRPYKMDHMYHCLFSKNGSCTSCIKRCPGGAISAEGMDKKKCRDYQSDYVQKIAPGRHGTEKAAGCGLCQCGVPCQDKQPVI